MIDVLPPPDICVSRYVLERHACEKPDQVFAVFETGGSWTYGQTLSRVRRIGAALQNLGVYQDDHVVVWLPNRLNTLGSDLLELSSSYDRVIMDLGAGIDRTVRSLSSRAGTTVVLTNTEPTALTDAYAFIKISIQANPTADIRVVINNCASHAEGRKTYATLRKACDTFLKYEPALLGVIRHDAHVLRSIRNQTAILTRYPNCDAADDVSAVVNVLLEGR